LRQHQLSIFIVREQAIGKGCAAAPARADLSFHVRSWGRDGLCYFAVGDVGAEDLNQLAALLKAPGV
jgi:hypothetical protein